MFRDWGFLLGEIWVLLALAALLGLLAGWLIWGRRDVSTGDVGQLKADLERCRAMGAQKDARIKALEAEAQVASAASVDNVDYDGDGLIEGEAEGRKPAALSSARDGGADDLKKIKGIGPKLEALCNRLGFYHFDQIAAWDAQEVAWVDANLEGFKGRVSRDAWVSQAKLLADGGETAFSKKVDGGSVY